MSKILVVGNSLAVTKTIEEVRQNNQDAQISLLCTESHLPYDRFLLPSLVAGKIKESQISPLDQNFFTNYRVDIIANERISRIGLKRKHLTTESKKQINYDRLMIADFGLVLHSQIKGAQKKGVFDASLLSSVKEMIKFLPFVDTIFVDVKNLQGFNMACALHVAGKEVIIISSDSTLLSQIFDEETGSLLKQIVESKGIRVLTGNKMDEILGDSEVKAVKLDSGKVVAAQMVVLDSSKLDLRDLEGDEGYEMIQDEFFSWTNVLKPFCFGFDVLDGFCMGVTQIPEGGREYLKFDAPQNVFKKIFAKDDFLLGAILFNAPSSQEQLSKLITDKTCISGQEEILIGG